MSDSVNAALLHDATWSNRRPLPPRRQAGPAKPPALPGYEDLEWIGEGGMGVVYRARDVRLKRVVAVKMIRSAQFSPERLAWFQAEAEALGRLQHPHVVQVFAREEARGQPVLVMEYVPGGTLDGLLRQGPLPAREAARLVAILARAVQYAHACGVVHRDLKPANVLLAPPVEGNSGTVRGAFPKISDFGLARLTDEGGHDTAGILQGTPAYMAPEQAEGAAAVGPAADVWALGVILFRALTGRLPFDADSAEEVLRRVRQAEPPPLRGIAPDVPADLERACLICLSKDPVRRPSAAGLAHLLEHGVFRTDEATRELPPSASRAHKPYRRAAYFVAAILAALALYRLFPTLDRGPQSPAAESALSPHAIPAQERPHTPLQVTSFEVTVAGTGLAIARDVGGARPGERLAVAFELAEPAHAYLMALRADGSERLLWPADAGVAPARVARLSPGGAALSIARDAEGIEAIALVASRRPLPPFAEWRRQVRGLRWHHMPPSRQALRADGERVEALLPGQGVVPPPPGPLVRHLDSVANALRYGGGIDAVRLLAFPVEEQAE